MEDERAIGTAEQLAGERDGARQPVMKRGDVGPKIERHDGGATRWARVIARIREARRGFEQHLELEQGFISPFELKRRQPSLALRTLLAVKGARLAEQRLIRIFTQG